MRRRACGLVNRFRALPTMILVCAALTLPVNETQSTAQEVSTTSEPTTDDVASASESSRFATTTIAPGERPYSQIDRDIDAFISRMTRAADRDERHAALQDLCGILEEIKRDPRLARSETLQGYKARVVSRLNQARKTLDAEVAREARMQERELRRSQAEQRNRERSSESGSNVDTASFPVSGLSQAGEQLSWNQLSDSTDSAVAEAMASQYHYLSASAGGGSSILMQAGGHYGGGAVASNASDLIELIHRTIQPTHWDVNGGPGTIFFYEPLNALVVRANSEVQSDLGRSLDELRRAGGR